MASHCQYTKRHMNRRSFVSSQAAVAIRTTDGGPDEREGLRLLSSSTRDADKSAGSYGSPTTSLVSSSSSSSSSPASRRSHHRSCNWRLLCIPSFALNTILISSILLHEEAPFLAIRTTRDAAADKVVSIREESTNNNNNTKPVGYVPYPKIFGHIHMAKTAGTEINGELAAHFERVCGHKG